MPPGDTDESDFPQWGKDGSGENSGSSPASPTRPTRRVAAVIDPSVNDDGLGLTGPGAPQSDFGDAIETHPVRERLLAKARASGAHPDAPLDVTPAKAAPAQASPAASPGLWGDDLQSDDDEEDAALERAFPSVRATSQVPNASQVPSPLPPPSPGEAWPGSSRSTAPLPPRTPPPGTPPPAAVASELERIARRPSSPDQASNISPNMIAVLGGLLGLTVISTLGVLLSDIEGGMAPVVKESKDEAPAEVQKKPEKKAEAKKPARQKMPGPWRIADDAAKASNRVLSGKVGKKAFLRAIQDAGLPKSEAYRAYTALKGLKDLDHCKSTDQFEALVTGSDKTLIAFEYSVNKEEVYQAKTNKDGRLEGHKLDLKVDRNQIRRAFTHDGKSFEESARRDGFDPGLAKIAETSLRGHSSMTDFRQGDRIRIIAQEVTVLGEFSRYSGIEAMEIFREGKDPRRIYYYSHPVEGGHFDKNGKAPYEGGWRKPIPNAPVTSKFNMKRMHPVLNKVMPHTGTDFGAPTGTPIGATSPGVVSFRGKAGASGNLVKIKHDGGYESGYAHLSRFGKIKVGDKVERLQTIGYCGSTGRSTGPHLHFTMKKDGAFIDAESLNLDGMRVLAKAHRQPFSEVRAKYDPILDQVPLPKAQAAPSQSPEEAAAPPAGMMPDPMGDPMGAPPAVPAQTATTQTAAQAKAVTPAAAAAPAKPAQAVTPSAIFLSDTELLKMQSRSDDGEVSE